MFIAIISDTYSEVKAEMSISEARYPISDYLDELKTKIAKKLNCYDDASQTMADAIKNLSFKGEFYGKMYFQLKFKENISKTKFFCFKNLEKFSISLFGIFINFENNYSLS